MTAKAQICKATPVSSGTTANRSTTCHGTGLAPQRVMKLSENPRMMPMAVIEPLRKVASMFWGGLLMDARVTSTRPWR